MAFRPLKKQYFNDFGLSLMMNHLVNWAEQFNSLSILDGRLIEDVEIDTDGISVDHKLGREPKGWIVVSKDQNKDVWQTDKSSSTLDLDSDASTSTPMTISLWVF